MDIDEIYTKYAHRVLETGNPTSAAIDVGVPKDSVNEFLKNAKEHDEVLRIFMEDEMDVPDFNDVDAVKTFILKNLRREAQYRGPGAQQAARIAALKTIGEIVGIEAARKIDLGGGSAGGVMLIPTVDAADWGNQAEAMQRELKEKARE